MQPSKELLVISNHYQVIVFIENVFADISPYIKRQTKHPIAELGEEFILTLNNYQMNNEIKIVLLPTDEKKYSGIEMIRAWEAGYKKGSNTALGKTSNGPQDDKELGLSKTEWIKKVLK